MGKWDYLTPDGIRENVEKLAMDVIREINKSNDVYTRGDICLKISGVLDLLDALVDDMDQYKHEEEKEQEEFAKSCKATAKAFNDLFEAKVWLTKEDKTNGPAT